VISLARNYQVENRLSIRLLELDRLGDFHQDGHLFRTETGSDLLGQVFIRDAGACSQVAVFRTGRAHYELTYRLAPMFELTASVGANGSNQADDILALKQRLIRLGFDWLTADTTMSDSTIQTIRLFQSIIRGRHTVGGIGVDGKVDVPGLTYHWLQACNAPRWQQMPAGSSAEGFINFELSDTTDHHDFGTDWMASAIKSIGRSYRTAYLANHLDAAFLSINDVSLPQGGNTPDHAGHQTGLGCDIRLPNVDGSSGGLVYSDSDYDQRAMRAMLIAVKNTQNWRRTFFNDPVLIEEGLCSGQANHDNHAHFEISPPQRIDATVA
jgi:hypothetical protein